MSDPIRMELHLCVDGSVRYYQVGRSVIELTYSQALTAFRMGVEVTVRFDCPRSDLAWYETDPTRFRHRFEDGFWGLETTPEGESQPLENNTIV